MQQSLAWGSDADAAMQQAIVRWTIALPYAMKAHCWKRRALSKDLHVGAVRALLQASTTVSASGLGTRPTRCVSECLQHLLQDVLLPHELEWLHQQPHFPTAVTQVSNSPSLQYCMENE